MNARLTLIYVYFNTPNELINSISSAIKYLRTNIKEIIIVNNDSPKPLPISHDVFEREKKKIVIIDNNYNFGYGKAANLGISQAKTNFILLLNPDTIILDKNIDKMIEIMKKNKQIAIMGPQLVGANGEILHSIASIPKLPDALFALSFLNKLFPKNPYSAIYWGLNLNRNNIQKVDSVGGAAMLINKALFKKIGGFDEKFFLYFEEIDLCKRANDLGYQIWYYPDAKIKHFLSKSIRDKRFIQLNYEKSRFYFFRKHNNLLVAFLSEIFLRISSFKKIKLNIL